MIYVLLVAGGLLLVLLTTTLVLVWALSGREGPLELLRPVAVTALGIISLFCVFGLLYLSTPASTALSYPEAETTDLPSGVAASNAATNQSVLGISQQIVSVLGTIGAGAVGGITGLLVGRRASGGGDGEDDTTTSPRTPEERQRQQEEAGEASRLPEGTE